MDSPSCIYILEQPDGSYQICLGTEVKLAAETCDCEAPGAKHWNAINVPKTLFCHAYARHAWICECGAIYLSRMR